MELAVLKIDGTQSGKNVTLPEKVFGIAPNDHAIYLDVIQYLANPAARPHTAPRSSVARRAAAVHVTAHAKLISS